MQFNEPNSYDQTATSKVKTNKQTLRRVHQNPLKVLLLLGLGLTQEVGADSLNKLPAFVCVNQSLDTERNLHKKDH